MSDTPMQTDIFGGETPMTTAEPAAAPVAVLRRPGWYLVASNFQGPRTWHRLTTGAVGMVITVCGRKGRVVPDSQREILLCPDCEAKP